MSNDPSDPNKPSGTNPTHGSRSDERAASDRPKDDTSGSSGGATAPRSMGRNTMAGFASTSADIRAMLKKRSVLRPVEFSFLSDGDATTDWRVVHIDCQETLSGLYSCTLELANQDITASPATILGHTATLTIRREPLERMVNGIVHRVIHAGHRAGHLTCRVVLVPALYVLTQRKNSRIFQDMTTPQIVADVMKKALEKFKRKVDISALSLGRYPRHEYCTQFNETDMNFVQRLMERDGIVFYFEPHVDGEIVRLVDKKEAYQKIVTLDLSDVEIAGPEGDTASAETIRRFDLAQQMQPTALILRDFNWTAPDRLIEHRHVGTEDGAKDREWYESDGHLSHSSYDPSQRQYTAENGAIRSKDLRDFFRSREFVIEGEGNVTSFSPGKTFRVHGHHQSELDKKYTITSVQHFGEASEELTSDTHSGEEGRQKRYWNKFTCVPFDVFWRAAPRAEPPFLPGVVSAMVTGPEGQEIYTDEHGRVKVQFHWDRDGKRTERSSCWMRVSQSLSGPGFGTLFLPRVGMEVLVSFIGGDPDRPVVTGTVYNGTHPPPYPLPENMTRSVIRTQSTPGGDPTRYNEVSLEDSAGREQLLFHAQRNLVEEVGYDHETTVANNQTVTVGHDQSQTVANDQTESVANTQTVQVGNDRKVSVAHDQTTNVGADQSLRVGGSSQLTAAQNATARIGGTMDLSVAQSLQVASNGMRVAVNGSQSAMVNQNATSSVGGNQIERIDGSSRTLVGGDRTETVQGSLTTMTVGAIVTQSEESVEIRPGPDNVIHVTPEGVLIRAKKFQLRAEELSITADKLQIRGEGTWSGQKVELKTGSAGVKLEENAVVYGSKVSLKTNGGGLSKKSTKDDPKTSHWVVRLVEPVAGEIGKVQALASRGFVATGHGPEPYEGTTDGDGIAKIPVVYPQCEIDVLIGRMVIRLAVGDLVQKKSSTGLRQRLYNLGYGDPHVESWSNSVEHHLIEMFQEDHGLKVTGWIDNETQAKIIALHGG